MSLRKGDRVTFKPSGATYNDVVGRIRPAGLVFDTRDLEITLSDMNIHNRLEENKKLCVCCQL